MFFCFFLFTTIPANIRLDKDVLKTSGRCLSSSSSLNVLKTSSRCLDQGEYIRFSHTSLEGVFKTSLRRLGQDQYIRLGHTSSRRFQDVLQRCLQDVFKTYHQVKLFVLTRLRDVFNTFLKRTAKTVIYRRIYLGHTSEKFMVSVQILQE